ncbi:hypothetical protein ACWEKT_33090 [Nocardia takedensis]
MTTSLAVAVNYATGGSHSMWVWVAVGLLTVGIFVTSLWVQRAQSPPADFSQPVFAVDLRNVKAGREIRVKGVRAGGVRARRVRSGADMTFEDIDLRRGDGTH